MPSEAVLAPSSACLAHYLSEWLFISLQLASTDFAVSFTKIAAGTRACTAT